MQQRIMFFCVCMHLCAYEQTYLCIFSVLHYISESTLIGCESCYGSNLFLVDAEE